MGKVLAFKKQGEGCGNCWYFFSRAENGGFAQNHSEGYCRHPEVMKVTDTDRMSVIKKDFQRRPDQWCPKYVHVDAPEMKKLQVLSGIKFSLLCLKKRPESTEKDVVDTEEYRNLVDFFYQENRKHVKINQYKAMRRDASYFMNLIDEMTTYYLKRSKDRRHRDV